MAEIARATMAEKRILMDCLGLNYSSDLEY